MVSYFKKVKKKCLIKIIAIKQCLFRQLFHRKNSVQDIGTKLSQIFQMMCKFPYALEYQKVTNNRLSWLVADARIFRLFDAYVL